MDKFAQLTGRQYHLFDYLGAADADRVVVVMASGCGRGRGDGREARGRRAEGRRAQGAALRPFDAQAFLAALPKIGQDDRRAGPHQGAGAVGEPLYQDVSPRWTSGRRATAPLPKVIGGRYGLSSKEFTPAMVGGGVRRAATSPAQSGISRSASSTT